MTDKDALFTYRLQAAEETLSEAERMLEGKFSPRAIVNRAYYAMFYALLALLLKTSSTMVRISQNFCLFQRVSLLSFL